MKPKLLLVGCGKMGSALSMRWREKRICEELAIVDPNFSRIKSPDMIANNFQPDIIVFAVKPQTAADILFEYRPFVAKGASVISIIAGKPTYFFEKSLGRNAKVIRAMPNTPAAIGEGISVAYANEYCTDKEKKYADTLLSAVGELLWVEDESLLNPVTALSGGGPAYLYLLVETMRDAGIHVGLDPKMAEKLAIQTIIGSTHLLEQNISSGPEKLRKDVTSPGGTTEAALDIFLSKNALQEIYNRAFAAATQRARDLAR